MVPTLSIVFMAVSMLITVGLPVALYIIFHKQFGGKFLPAIIGALAFIVFALVLESLLHQLVLRPDETGSIALLQKPFLYVLYGTLVAGVFEETARFVSFLFLRRNYHGVGNALTYGVGHGGAEAILLVGFAMFNNIVLALTINNGGLGAILAPLDAATAAQVQAGADQMIGYPPYMFLLAGAERVFALVIHIALSVLVYYAVTRAGKWWLYPAAILLHALCNVPAALLQAGVLSDMLLVEALTLLMAVFCAVLAVITYRKLGDDAPQSAPPTQPQPVA